MSSKSSIRFARRVTEMESSKTLGMLNRARELAAQGVDVIDFGPGEPDFATPRSVAAAGQRAIEEGFTRYTNALGTTELRQAIASYYNRRYGTAVGGANVIAGNGGKQELFNLMLALVGEGDEVIIPGPFWVSFPDQVRFAGGAPVIVDTDPANHFRPTLELIEAAVTARTRGVILNSPANPTGAVIEERELERIVELCVSREMFLVFDETYEFFVYDGNRHVSAIRWMEKYPETVIIVNSFSKTFAMTGWRLGYAIAHPEIVAALGKIQSHSTSNPSSIAQFAAIEAINSGDAEVQRMYEAYSERRSWLVPALNDIPGFACPWPDGAFYVFPRVSSLYGLESSVRDSDGLATYFLNEAHVSVVPGSSFGAEDFIRISYATSMDKLHEGVKRLRAAVEKLLASSPAAAR